ncbi:hypothetical protein C5E44_03750 [Nocardia nova]|nr:hypothetical protein C5E44_03750 [Nocardia nova]
MQPNFRASYLSRRSPHLATALHMCAVEDVFSNRIVCYAIDSRMKSRLAVTALNNAVARRDDVAGCVESPRGVGRLQPL